MKTVYLKNGQACYLKEQIGDKYIVNKIYEVDGEHGYEEAVDDNDVVVDKVYQERPIEKIDAEVRELQSRANLLKGELNILSAQKSSLERECQRITKTQVDNERFIINKTDLMKAKSIALFPRDRVMPFVLSDQDQSFSRLEVSFNISLSRNEEKSWGYKIREDYSDKYGEFLCPKYGILINPTAEEIDATIVKRLQELKFTEQELSRVDNKYLTAQQITVKDAYLTKTIEANIVAARRRLANEQAILDKLLVDSKS